jgi:hypothetical protein
VNKTTRHIFTLFMVFSVFSLTLQASIISFCKESKVFKNQNQQNPVAEEEEESHDADEETDGIFYLDNDLTFSLSYFSSKIFWSKPDNQCLSMTKSIPIPPPKF